MPNPHPDLLQASVQAAALTIVDTLVRKHTAFQGLADLCAAPAYRPTLLVSEQGQRGAELFLIAEAYDESMRRMGDARISYRT